MIRRGDVIDSYSYVSMNFASHYRMKVSCRFKILDLKVLSSIIIKYFSKIHINQHKFFCQ